MARSFIVQILGQPDQTFYGPGAVRKAIEEVVGKARGRQWVVPQVARMGDGDVYKPTPEIIVTCVGDVDETEVHPVGPVRTPIFEEPYTEPSEPKFEDEAPDEVPRAPD